MMRSESFEEIVYGMIQVGARREKFFSISLLMPGGRRDEELYTGAVRWLVDIGFVTLDLQDPSGFASTAASRFPLRAWPTIVDAWPSREWDIPVPESQQRLLLLCSRRSEHKNFWRNLGEHGAFECGVFPSRHIPSVVVPRGACVIAIVKCSDYDHDDFPHRSLGRYSGMCARFTWDDVPFALP
jgi:hypothetical protein